MKRSSSRKYAKTTSEAKTTFSTRISAPTIKRDAVTASTKKTTVPSAEEPDQKRDDKQNPTFKPQLPVLKLTKNSTKLALTTVDRTKAEVLRKIFRKNARPKSRLNATQNYVHQDVEMDEWSLKDHPSWEILFNMVLPSLLDEKPKSTTSTSSCTDEVQIAKKMLKKYRKYKKRKRYYENLLLGKVQKKHKHRCRHSKEKVESLDSVKTMPSV